MFYFLRLLISYNYISRWIDQQTVYFKEWITGKAGHLKLPTTCSSNKLLSLGMEEGEHLGLESNSHCDGNSRFKIFTFCHFLSSGDLRLCVKMCYKLAWVIFWKVLPSPSECEKSELVLGWRVRGLILAQVELVIVLIPMQLWTSKSASIWAMKKPGRK